MKILATLLILFAFTAAALPAVPKISSEDEASVDRASDIAKRFLSAVDRKRPDVAERMSYVARRETPQGITNRFALVSEGAVHHQIQVRERYGNLLSRELTQTRVTKSHPNMPDSRFVEFQYELKFQKKERVVEHLKVKIDGDQKWKVVSYSSL